MGRGGHCHLGLFSGADTRHSAAIGVRRFDLGPLTPALVARPGLHLPRGPELCPTAPMSCLLLAAPPTPSHCPFCTHTALAVPWPCHFPEGIRCRGKLAALRGEWVLADLILGAASPIRLGGGCVCAEEPGAGGIREVQGPLPLACFLSVHTSLAPAGPSARGWAGLSVSGPAQPRPADLPAPTPRLTPPSFISPLAAAPIGHLIPGPASLSGSCKISRGPQGAPGGLSAAGPAAWGPLPSGGSTWEWCPAF